MGNDSALALSTTAVGVGNAAPAYKLDVTGDIRTSVASGNGSLYINNSSLTSKFWTFIPETAAGETNLLFFYGGTGAGTKMILTNGGNVGIGNSSPLNQLDLNNTGAPTLFDAGLDVVQNGGTIELNYIAAGRSGGRDGAHIFKTGLTTGGTEIARFTTNGLTFNGDTAAANALDDYEEGTWTPVITDITNDATMISGAIGNYTKIGRQVTLSAYCRTTSIGSVTGDIYIKGMPFTSNGNLGSETSVTFGYFTGMSLGSAGVSVGAYIVPATTRMQLYINDVSTGITAMQASEWSNTGYVHLGITYFV